MFFAIDLGQRPQLPRLCDRVFDSQRAMHLATGFLINHLLRQHLWHQYQSVALLTIIPGTTQQSCTLLSSILPLPDEGCSELRWYQRQCVYPYWVYH
ncbi:MULTISPECIES: hypothetical protein [unclassified Moorena]|uniref:hypothetical protein n=1 Tax=unclassified Moorena TaxID=2683338 RepID=UPI0013FCED33|nr:MULTISPECIES: hypothetical protein [unclassified Moorena]NEP27042.1 hypothetical protein [Moorena sp. SIO3I6]